MSTLSPTQAPRASRLFWVAGVILYLVPLFLLALHTEGGWSTSPFLILTYGVLSLATFWLVTRQVEVKEVVVEKVVESASPALTRALSEKEEELVKKEGEIEQLQAKIKELSKEIRTLLQLEGPKGVRPVKALAFDLDAWVEQMPESSSQEVRTQYDAYVLLQRCLEKAEHLGSSHLRSSPRFAQLGFEHPSLEIRRLSDALRDEMSAAVLFFSPLEERLLFANNIVRAYTGYNPERFVRDFLHILGPSLEQWRGAIDSLVEGQEKGLSLTLHSESGRSLAFECCMGAVSSGPFEGMVIAILYRH
ncbi:MAG: hypothetical protein JSR80_01320 [Verrucomicrobia bacterium]|nr:hypothetical protein [Verrucomicrobiota bacterium]